MQYVISLSKFLRSFFLSKFYLSCSLDTVVTVNDYLAQRDAEWMGRVHRFLGLSVGLIQVISCLYICLEGFAPMGHDS